MRFEQHTNRGGHTAYHVKDSDRQTGGKGTTLVGAITEAIAVDVLCRP